MAEQKIPLSDLPRQPAGNLDSIAGVDQATQKAALFPVTALPMPQGVADAIKSLRDSQTAGMIGFSTKALMDAAAGSYPANTLALVTNDPVAANNGTYRRTGGSSPAWAKADDRVSQLESGANAEGLLLGTSSGAINFDIAGGQLRIANGVRAHYGRTVSSLLPSQEVALPTGSLSYYLALNPSTLELSFHTQTTATPGGFVRVGSYRPAAQVVSGIPFFSVNGLAIELDPNAATGRLVGATSTIVFDTVARTLYIAPSSVRVLWGRNSQFVPEQTVTLPASVTARIVFDPASGNLLFRDRGLAMLPGTIDVGTFNAATGAVAGIPEYTIDGIANTSQLEHAGSLVADGADINFDFSSGLLRLSGGSIRAVFGDRNSLLPAQDVPIPSSTVWNLITLNQSTLAITISPASSPRSRGEVVVGAIRPSTREITGIGRYHINGNPPETAAVSLRDARALVIDHAPLYESPAQPSFEWISSVTHGDIYGVYDALVSAYPDYVSRTLLGDDDDGNPVYRYDFRAPPVDTVLASDRPNKMILISGVHGFERAGVWALYLAMKAICEGWEQDETLEMLRWGCHFIVVPVAVPYGLNNNIRKNENGVDVARNFPANWSASDPSSPTYGGEHPLSEKSTQYLDAIMSENQDAIYCGSFHNFFTQGDSNRFIWNASATNFGIEISKSLISKLSRSWKGRFAWLPQDNTTYVGYADRGAPPASEGAQATIGYGIQGGTFEICWRYEAHSPDTYTAIVAQLGCETVVNWLAFNLRNAPGFYNARGM